jgi:hypothetical protein
VVGHLAGFFEGHEMAVLEWARGPIEERIQGFRVVRLGPGPRTEMWSYVSVGCWRATQQDGHGLEFVIIGEHADERLVELSAMNAYFHAGPPEQRLDVGHTVPIGEPWLPGSDCDHFLVSLPYPFGPDFEVCEWDAGHARLLWLLPITKAERDFKAANGREALEQRFDDAAIRFWEPERRSVI